MAQFLSALLILCASIVAPLQYPSLTPSLVEEEGECVLYDPLDPKPFVPLDYLRLGVIYCDISYFSPPMSLSFKLSLVLFILDAVSRFYFFCLH